MLQAPAIPMTVSRKNKVRSGDPESALLWNPHGGYQYAGIPAPNRILVKYPDLGGEKQCQQAMWSDGAFTRSMHGN